MTTNLQAPFPRKGEIVTHDDAKAFGYCNAGLRKWFRVRASPLTTFGSKV